MLDELRAFGAGTGGAPHPFLTEGALFEFEAANSLAATICMLRDVVRINAEVSKVREAVEPVLEVAGHVAGLLGPEAIE